MKQKFYVIFIAILQSFLVACSNTKVENEGFIAPEIINEIESGDEEYETVDKTVMVELPEVEAKNNEYDYVVWNANYASIEDASGITREEHIKNKTSYEETVLAYEWAKSVIEENDKDLSYLKVAIIGDSLTVGYPMNDDEIEKYAWPNVMSRILGCEYESAAISGSTVGKKKGHDPMYSRWAEEMSDDCDIVIVFGGTNDVQVQEYLPFGDVNQLEEGTFCGDLDTMLAGMERRYVEESEKPCRLIYINPPMCRCSRAYSAMSDEFLQQDSYADAINIIASRHQFEVIDLYNNNLFDSCDDELYQKLSDIDGLHLNCEGYELLGYYITAQIIRGNR